MRYSDLWHGRGLLRILLVGVVVFLLIGQIPCAAALSITAYLGEEVPLSGSGSGTDTVYLFVTGPNLPQNGGNLQQPFSQVVTGDPETFTRAEVGADTHWTVTWDTSGIGLDAGTYLVYAVDAPVGRSDLSGHSYAVTPVILIGPGSGGVVTAVTTPATPPVTTTLPPRTSPTAAATATSPEPTAIPAPVGAVVLACVVASVAWVRRR